MAEQLTEMDLRIRLTDAVLQLHASQRELSRVYRQLREARAEVEQLRAAIEPGTASAVAAGVSREAERLGFSPYSSKPALTWLVEEIERLRALLSEAADDIEEWGGYAADYFNEKWGLDECVEKYRRALRPESEGNDGE